MTKGSWIHDDLSGHLDRCMQCRAVDAESVRTRRPEGQRLSVDAETLAALCPDGRSIYRSYLRWLAEPDD
jgi:hypothetical protein